MPDSLPKRAGTIGGGSGLLYGAMEKGT